MVNLIDPENAAITMTALNGYAIGGNKAFDLNTNGVVSISPVTGGFSDTTSSNLAENNVSEFGRFNLIFDDGPGFRNPYFEVVVMLRLQSGEWSSASDVLAPNDKGYIAAGYFGVLVADIGYVDTGFAGDGTLFPNRRQCFCLVLG